MNICEYRAINDSFDRRFVFHFGEKAGFYSEYNNMILAILYCILKNIKFEIYSDDANFCFNQGWTDYFEPFCNESHCFIHHFTNKRGHPKKAIRQRFYRNFNRIFNPDLLITSDLWFQIRSIDKNLNFDEVNKFFPNVNNLQEVCKVLIDLTYRFNEKTRNEVDLIKSKVNFSGSYVGFHIRGGDKFLEHDLLNIDEYISKAESVTDLKDGFIYTDDFRLYELVSARYPEWKFQTLTQPTECGYFHKQFVKLPDIQRRSKIIQMFASLELLCESSHVICTYSSNIGMFLGMRKIDNIHGLDFNQWLLW